MKNLLSNKTFLLAVAIVGFALAFIAQAAYAAWAGVVAMFALLRWMRQVEGEKNWKIIEGALAKYEVIIGGQLWNGKDAEVLASDRLDNPRQSGPVRFEHICRTKNGAWFLFQVAVTHGRLVDIDLTPIDEATARLRLQSHRDVYIRCFGQPIAA